MAVPASITEPRKGKWWDENEGKWVETDLTKEKAMLESVPEDNSDVSSAPSFIILHHSSLICYLQFLYWHKHRFLET